MKNWAEWRPTNFELHRGPWRVGRDAGELGIGSRLTGDRVRWKWLCRLPPAGSGGCQVGAARSAVL